MSPADPLAADALRAALGRQVIGREIVVLDETTSTNDVIARMAPAHEEGLVVFAERQTAGRGQYGRAWESASGKGLWLSILLRPGIAVADSARLTNFLALAIATTLSETLSLDTIIKPPNDIYIASRKIAGVLVEMRVEANGEYCAIAGIGLNVNQSRADFPAALQETAGSLALVTGRPVDRFALAVALLRILDDRYREFRA